MYIFKYFYFRNWMGTIVTATMGMLKKKKKKKKLPTVKIAEYRCQTPFGDSGMTRGVISGDMKIERGDE